MKRLLNILLKSILVIFVLLNLIILFSGRWYLYKAILNTYFKGRNGPSSTEYQIFENRPIQALKPSPWPISKHYNTQRVSGDFDSLMHIINAHAFVIIKNDTLIHEQYWDDFSDTSHTNSFSMAKSYTSALLGCAIKDGYIKSLDEPVSSYIPEFKEGWRSRITLKNLVTMTSGIDFDESYLNPFSFPAEGYYGSNLLKACTDYKDVKQEPGTVFDYLSGNTALLGYCITKAVGKPLATYLSEKLWTPLGCEHTAYWSLDKKDGLEKAFCCINSNAKDFARMGKLYMHHGNWNGQQLVDSAYAAQSVVPFDCKEKDATPNHTYGYAWWLTDYKGMRIYYMQGMLGQYVICVPEKNMVICRLARSRRIKGKDHTPLDVSYCVDEALHMYWDK
jgi:CubicO group peptidase (beta-lactamase class C family)